MAAPSLFRRWKRFFSSFETIDTAILASDPGGELALIAGDLRHYKARVVQFLCDAPNEELAEDFCKTLDELMVEYLITLKAVPVKPAALKSTGVVRAVAALQEHESGQIRGLAREMLARWRAAVESDIPDARAIAEELIKISDLVPVSRSPVVRQSRTSCRAAAAADSGKNTDAPPCRAMTGLADKDAMDKMKTPCLASDSGKKMAVSDALPCRARIVRADAANVVAKIKTPCLSAAADSGKKTPVSDAPPCSRAKPFGADTAGIAKTKTPAVLGNGQADEIEKMKTTKRKLLEGYKEYEDAKRQRRIQIIEAPKVPEQRPRKVHPILRERSRSRCGAAPAFVKRSLMPAFQWI